MPNDTRPAGDGLADFLSHQFGDGIELTIDEVAFFLGSPLPKRALRPGWWTTPPRTSARLSKPWHRAGFQAELLPGVGRVRFERRTSLAAAWEYGDHGRWVYLKGGRRIRYTAIDPAGLAFRCPCGTATCVRLRQLPFRDHVIALHRALSSAHNDEYDFAFTWSSVAYGLKLAASIRDVEADTGIVEDPETFAMCEASGEYEDGASEMASKYVAAASIFNFLWLAYESAVSLVEPSNMRGLLNQGRLAERGRRLFEEHPELTGKLTGQQDALQLAFFQCRAGGRMDERLDRVKSRYPDNSLATAADLVREFRNFIAHGEDEVPDHPGWMGDAGLSSYGRLYRFYSVGRVLLLLIQALGWIYAQNSTSTYEQGNDETDLAVRLQRLHLRDA